MVDSFDTCLRRARQAMQGWLAALLLALAPLAAQGHMDWVCCVPFGAVSGMGTWERTLQPRDLDNDGDLDAVYDRLLNITWLTAADLTRQPTSPLGPTTWINAENWAASLSVGGFDDWRLPALRSDSQSCDNNPLCSRFQGGRCGFDPYCRWMPELYDSDGVVYSELAHLFYVTLGNFSRNLEDDYNHCQPDPYVPPETLRYCETVNTGGYFPITGSLPWWTGTATYEGFLNADGSHGGAWAFWFGSGYQGILGPEGYSELASGGNVIAVHDGDIGTPIALPLPSSFALAALALALLGLRARRR